MPNPYLPFPAEIIDIIKETEIDYTFRLQAQLDVQCGQFIEVSLPKVGEAPISVSDFDKDYIDLTIRRVGKVTDVLHELKKGDNFFIRGPYGNGFPIEEFAGKDLIIAAGGTGLAPVKSLINMYYNEKLPAKSLKLLAGFKSPDDMLFDKDLENWKRKFPVNITVDKGNPNWDGRVGLITELVKELEIKDKENVQIIVVGPPAMMKFTTQEFKKKGIDVDNIYVSFERKMSCGIGKCGHCKIDETYVCLEGPVFKYAKAVNLID